MGKSFQQRNCHRKFQRYELRRPDFIGAI